MERAMLIAAASTVRAVGMVEISVGEGKGKKTAGIGYADFGRIIRSKTRFNGSVHSTVPRGHAEENPSKRPAEIECVSGILSVTT